MHVLQRLDLNLLVLFDAVVAHRQVTAAASSLGLSQSAASHALARLRDAVGDPLFVRGAGGLVLTPRAEVLARAARGALSALVHALEQDAVFAPASSTRRFRIAAADGFDIVVLPPLLERLGQVAPRLDLAVVRPDVGQLAALLEAGDIDLYYGVLPDRPSFAGLLPDPGVAALRTAKVYDEGWVCLARADHPRVRRAPSVEAYAREGHVLYSPTGDGPGVVDRLLEARGLARRVAVRVSSFHAALDAVRRTDLVWTGPARIADVLDPERRLRRVRPPLDLPTYPARIVWHDRVDRDPGHRWFREQVLAAAATVGAVSARRAPAAASARPDRRGAAPGHGGRRRAPRAPGRRRSARRARAARRSWRSSRR